MPAIPIACRFEGVSRVVNVVLAKRDDVYVPGRLAFADEPWKNARNSGSGTVPAQLESLNVAPQPPAMLTRRLLAALRTSLAKPFSMMLTSLRLSWRSS